ncbi:MAG: NAD(P)-binding domain-containing protein, partial [Pedobacter sp.]
MKMYYEKDCKLSTIKEMKIAILGYGSQGHAHANNLKESGVDVIVGELAGSDNFNKAKAAGFQVFEAAEAVKKADVVVIL